MAKNAKKTTKAAVEEVKAVVEEVKVTEEVKAVEEVKAEAVKAEEVKEEKAPAKKTAAKKTTKAADKEEKETKTTKKTTKKAEVKREIFLQYCGNQVDEAALLEKVEDDCAAQGVAIKELKLYLKPEDNACYYVANGNVAGKVDLY